MENGANFKVNPSKSRLCTKLNKNSNGNVVEWGILFFNGHTEKKEEIFCALRQWQFTVTGLLL